MTAAKYLLVSVAGILGFVATVVVLAAFEHFTGFNLFSFSLFIVVPAGALLSGFAAASGFYLASLWLQVRPNWFILLQIIIVAALAQIAIYYAGYWSLVLDDGTVVADRIGFKEYLDIYLSSQHIRVGRGSVDAGEVGQFGWWLAGIEYIGFLVGGVAAFLLLRAYPSCQGCNLYLRKIAKKEQFFSEQDDFGRYYDQLFNYGVDGPEFKSLLQWSPKEGKSEKGNIQVQSILRRCPSCKEEFMTQEVKVFAKDGWKDVPKLTRHVSMPTGVSVSNAFN